MATVQPAYATRRNHLRALLYVPADKMRALEKAASLGADAIIIDLEDAVSAGNKTLARHAARDYLIARSASPNAFAPMILRVNALDSGLGADDLMMAASAKPDAILLPKVSSARDVTQVAGLLDQAGMGDVPLWAMIETPMALLHLNEICQAAPGRLQAFVAGTNDYAKEIGLAPRGDEERRALLQPFLFHIVNAARAYGLRAYDGVMNRLGDDQGLGAEASLARAMGFDGKTLIHPAQIPICKAAFAPSAQEIARAKAIVAAFAQVDNAAKGAIALNGEMVERLHLAEAEQLLASVKEPN